MSTTQTAAAASIAAYAPVRHLIGGESVEASNGATFETRDPHDGSLLAHVAEGTAEDGVRAIVAARRAFDVGPWGRMSVKERAALMYRLADLVVENLDELAELECRDGGKPIFGLRHAEIPRVAHNLRFFADYASMAENEAIPDQGLFSYTLYPAAGVVAAISPWNAPLMLATWKIAPALAFGNTVILKPAPQTPLTARRFGELALEAGFPEGVINVVHGFGGEAVAGPLTSDPRVDRITFTGSSVTGSKILAAAAPNMTPVSAELGGKSANLVFDDADLDVAVPEAVRGVFLGNGQMCLAGTRMFVQRGIREAFMERFVEETRKLRVGDPKDESTFMGPLIEQRHLDKVAGYVDLAREEGGDVIEGGARLTGPEYDAGTYYPPTILDGMTNSMRAAREEIFGPVQSVIDFETEEEGLRLANDTPYGLAGLVFTNDVNRVHRIASHLKAGTVWVNCYFQRDLRLPFGGEGLSGLGREGGRFSRDFFTEPRAVTIKLR